MHKSSVIILRIGLAITFIWIGMLILKQPAEWGAFIQPWAVKFIPVSITQLMIGTGALDILIGILLLTGSFVWLVALVAALHLIAILIASGVTSVTIRDVGLLAASLALLIDSWPFRKAGENVF